MQVTDEFKRAFELLEQGDRNVFVTGKAGTGKSTFLNYFRKHSKKRIVVVAPTGVAALNVRGQTIHSFFGLKPGFIDVNHLKPNRWKKTFSKIDVLIVDEISMVRADVFDAMEKVLRMNGPHRGAPFGGVQVCVVGDLFQLPPVVSREEQEIFPQLYETPYFFSSRAFTLAEFELVKFDTIFRQSHNEFIQVLNKVRVGHASPDILAFLNSRYRQDVVMEEGTVTLTTTNATADKINSHRLAALAGQERVYEGRVEGLFDVSGAKLPAPLQLGLKVGAQVMFTKNDSSEDKRWVNGSLGRVTQLSQTAIYVMLVDEENPKEVRVEKEKWTSVRYHYNAEEDKIVEEETGGYEQYPLMLAWAVTIHKSQGKTLDKVVIDLGYGAFATGQLYVALSRCRSFEHVVLKRPVREADVLCDAAVSQFIRTYQPPQRLL